MDIERHHALHEAGHAVVGSVLGLHVADVGYNPPAEDAPFRFPATTRFDEGDPCYLIGSRPDVMVVVMMAGSTAESVVLGRARAIR